MIAAATGTSCLRSTPLAVRVLFPPPAQPANEAARRSTADFAASAARSGAPDDGRLSGRFTQAHYPDTEQPAWVTLAAYAFPHAGAERRSTGRRRGGAPRCRQRAAGPRLGTGLD